MITTQLLPLLRNELAKASRRRLPYFGLLAIGLLCVIIYFVAGQISAASTSNGWGYVGFSMQIVFTDIGPIFTVVFAAMLISEETGTGTIRAALAAPIHRWELYLAKALAALIYVAVLSTAALLCSLVLAKIHFHFGDVGDSYGVVYTQAKAAREFFIGFGLSWIPLGALAMYGLLISTLIRSPGAAVAVGVASLFLIDFTKHLVGLDPYIFTRYVNYSWLNIQQMAQGMDFQWQPEVMKMFLLSGISALVSFIAGLVIFVRKDLNH